MSENRLVLNTKKSLYEPTEIEIDKQVYQSVKVTTAMLKEIDKIDDEIMKNPTSDKLLYSIVQLLFDITPAVLDKLDRREVEDIYTFSKRKFAEIEMQRAEIITKSFENTFQLGKKKKETQGKIPSGKRPGGKR